MQQQGLGGKNRAKSWIPYSARARTQAESVSQLSSYWGIYLGGKYTHMMQGFPGGATVKNPLANAGDAGDKGSVPGLGRSPGGGYGNPLQYFWLENPMERKAWWATVHRVTKSRTWLKPLNTYTHIHDAVHRSTRKPASLPWGHLPKTIQLLKMPVGPRFTRTVNGDNSLVFQMQNLVHLTYFLYWKPMKKGKHFPNFTWHIGSLEGVRGFS